MNEDPDAPQMESEARVGVNELNITVPFPDTYVYSNASALSMSFLDIRIGFAEVMSDGKVQPRIGVVVPPEHAAQLALNLFKQLNVFEQVFGDIRLPEWKNFKAKAKAKVDAEMKIHSIIPPNEERP